MPKLSHTLSQLFVPRKKDYVQVYLFRFKTVEKYLDCGLLAMDLESKFIMLDASLHIEYMETDRKYAAFFDTLRAYMNYRRGLLNMPAVEYVDRINFTVALKQIITFDEQSGEFYHPPKEVPHPLIVGYYQSGKVDYAAYEENDSH